MKLEDQVVSLELAKQMKDLGFKQESEWYWDYSDIPTESGDPWVLMRDDQLGESHWELTDGIDTFSTYTVAELKEMLPDLYNTCRVQCDYVGEGSRYFKGKWLSYSTEMGQKVFLFKGKHEADARAKMLIYLAENNLINPKEL